MNKITSGIKLVASISCVLVAFFTVMELMLFLSYNFSKTVQSDESINWISTSRALFVNTLLISLFIFQHSFLALPVVKNVYKKYNLLDIERTIYNITTCIVLQLLMKNWQEINSVTLWSINNNSTILWLYSIMHIFAWMLIYVGCVCMDINDLLGVKQVYYSINKLPNPNCMKSQELLKLFNHMRHPSFIGFLVIFWFTPIMSLDRLLLSVMVSLYMYIAWRNEESDYQYQKYQYVRKYHELNNLN